jgi:hypothetical protein
VTGMNNDQGHNDQSMIKHECPIGISCLVIAHDWSL